MSSGDDTYVNAIIAMVTIDKMLFLGENTNTKSVAIRIKLSYCFSFYPLHLPPQALLSALVEASGDETSFEAVLGDCKVVLDSIEGEHGMRIIVDDLLLRIKSNDAGTRHASVVLLCAFCQVSWKVVAIVIHSIVYTPPTTVMLLCLKTIACGWELMM